MRSYEYAHLATPTNAVQVLVVKLNDMAADGWELVSSHSADKTLGLNEVTALVRREIDPLPQDDISEGRRSDPSGRHKDRYWNGRAWTFHVADDGKRDRDPPTLRPPTPGLAR